MKHIGYMFIIPERAIELENFCKQPLQEIPIQDGQEFDREYVFPNGMRMAIQVCYPNTSDEACWTQGVLFSPDGIEVGCTDVGDSFLGEYLVPYEDDDYEVTVASHTDITIKERLEYLRGEIEAESISYEEIAELQALALYIDPSDTLLLEWAGVPEFEG